MPQQSCQARRPCLGQQRDSAQHISRRFICAKARAFLCRREYGKLSTAAIINAMCALTSQRVALLETCRTTAGLQRTEHTTLTDHVTNASSSSCFPSLLGGLPWTDVVYEIHQCIVLCWEARACFIKVRLHSTRVQTAGCTCDATL